MATRTFGRQSKGRQGHLAYRKKADKIRPSKDADEGKLLQYFCILIQKVLHGLRATNRSAYRIVGQMVQNHLLAGNLRSFPQDSCYKINDGKLDRKIEKPVNLGKKLGNL